jgi:hypothetical protein
MLDRREMPLIIDQPEDNFDNKSVYEILVKFLKRAKKRRQIVIVRDQASERRVALDSHSPTPPGFEDWAPNDTRWGTFTT